MVLHLRQEDFVTLRHPGPKACSHQVQGFCRASGEDDLRRCRPYEPGNIFSRVFIEFSRFIRKRMQATVHIGVAVPHQVRHGLDHNLGLLGRGGAIEVDKGTVADTPGEDRELRPDGLGIEGHSPDPPMRPCSQARMRPAAAAHWMRSMTSPRKDARSRDRASASGSPLWRM